MNEKLKQSLDTRLGGMRWGERDQQEVFRLCQRKELQDVKHVKRGTGMLAVAIALLFIVMGAAFALTTTADPPADNQVAGQTHQPAFSPVVSHLYENAYFTLDVDASACTETEASFTATLRMKDPAAHMLSLSGHTPPGDVRRTLIPVSLSGGVTTTLSGDIPLVSGQFSDVDVTDMTPDTAVVNASFSVASLYEDVVFTLFITWTDPADGAEHSDTVTWRTDMPAQQGMLLGEFDLVTVTMTGYTADGVPGDVSGQLTLSIFPAKPWYVLNREEDGKSTLTVSAETLLIYPTCDYYELLGMVDAREPASGELPVALEVTPDGLCLTAEGPLPAEELLYGYLVLHVYSDAAEAHYDEGFDDHYYEVLVPMTSIPAAAATVTPMPTVTAAPIAVLPTPAPMPTVTAAPAAVLPTPTPMPSVNRLWLFENELITGYNVSTSIEGEFLRVTIDVIPKNTDHVINTNVPGKTRLNVSTAWYGGYDDSTILQRLSVTDGAFVATQDGARLSALLPFPEEHQTLTYTLHITTIGNGTQHENVSISTFYRPGAYPSPTPVPAAAISPMPTSRPEPTGEIIGETDTVSIYLESSWYDGFSGEVTLRVRANDPAIRLATAPHLEDHPDEQTWVVQAEVTWNDYYRSCITAALTPEDSTGDVLVDLVYEDPIATGDTSFTLPITVKAVNEKTWQTEAAELTFPLKVGEEFAWNPLYLLESDSPDAFIQAGYIITDLYTYVGVMQTYDNHYPAFILADAEGNVLASRTSSPASNPAIERLLFPDVSISATSVTTSVVRLEGTHPLPETLLASFHTQGGDYLRRFTLSTMSPQSRRSQPTGNRLGGNDIVSVYLEESWSDGFTTIATLRIRAEDAAHRLAITPNANGMPDGSTWVVQLTDSEIATAAADIQLQQDTLSGDLLAQITFVDLDDRYQDGLLDLVLTTTNELTWERHSDAFRPVLPHTRKAQARTLHLVSSSLDGAFVQGSLLTTDRYHYIGLMLNADTVGNVLATLPFCEDPETISSGMFNWGSAMEMFPKVLFPYSGDNEAEFRLVVLRTDKDVELPDPLGVSLVTGNSNTHVADLVLSTTQPTETVSAPQP